MVKRVWDSVSGVLGTLWQSWRLRVVLGLLCYAAGAAAVGFVAIVLRHAEEDTEGQSMLFTSYWPIWVAGLVLVAVAVLIWPRRGRGSA